jgi:hypothetical protein
MAKRGYGARTTGDRGVSVAWAAVGLLALLSACTVERGGAPGGEPGLGGAAGATALGGSGAVAGTAGAGLEAGAAGTAGAGGQAPSCDAQAAAYATQVVSVSYGPGAGFGQADMPGIVLGPPHGGGCCAGSLDVLSLGNGGEIVLGFGPATIVDGPGPDFIVFENPFEIGGNPDAIFAELATVAVSADGVSWREFPCTASEPPWGSCAGWHPVYQDGDTGPLDPSAAGGDAFDLADVGLSEARYVRIVDRADLEGAAGVFDLDAVGIVHPGCP